MQSGNFLPASPVSAIASAMKIKIGPRQECSKNIKLHYRGEHIDKIEVQCSCGEIILLQCQYE